MPKEPDLLEGQFDEKNPRWQIHVLGTRVEALTKEKEKLERDLEKAQEDRNDLWTKHYDLERKVDKALNRGAGILFILPFFGIVVGALISYITKFIRSGP